MAGAMSAASMPVTLADGSQWEMSPLTDRDYDELTNWVQSYVIQVAREAARADDVTELEADRMMRLALEKSLVTTWQSATGRKLFGTPPGVARLFFQSIRRRHPNVLEIHFRQHFQVSENVRTVMAVFFDINSRNRARPTVPVPAATPEPVSENAPQQK